jgi:hypothetical protein
MRGTTFWSLLFLLMISLDEAYPNKNGSVLLDRAVF